MRARLDRLTTLVPLMGLSLLSACCSVFQTCPPDPPPAPPGILKIAPAQAPVPAAPVVPGGGVVPY